MRGRATGRPFSVEVMSEEEIWEGGGTANPFIIGQLSMRNMGSFCGRACTGHEMAGFDGFLERVKNALDETYAQLHR